MGQCCRLRSASTAIQSWAYSERMARCMHLGHQIEPDFQRRLASYDIPTDDSHRPVSNSVVSSYNQASRLGLLDSHSGSRE